jgi:hypothetical protein
MRRHVPLNTIKRKECRLVGDTVTHTPTGKWFRAYPGMPDICLENIVDIGEYSECEIRQMAALVLADRLKRKSDPLAPALAPGIAIQEEADANATPGTYLDDGGKEIVKALEALPIGSPIVFASEDFAALLLADAPIVRSTEAYRQVERLAQTRSPVSQEKTNTITFYRNETAIKHEANEDSGLKARGGVGAWGFCVEDRRFLIELFASVILMVTYIVLASIQSEEARRPEQYLGRSGDSQIKAAPTTASSSSGAQSEGEERLGLAAEKKRQEEAAAEKEADHLALEAEKKAVSADLPIFAPSRVVLTYPRNDKAAAERTTALRQALTAANVEVVKVEAVDSRPTPGIGYYFRSDHEAAVDVSHRVQPLLGPVEPALLELRGKVPPPGTVEIAVPGRGAR